MTSQASTTSSVLRIFVKSQSVTIASSDLRWSGNNCAQPMGTSVFNRSGKADRTFPNEQLIFLDAVTRAIDQTGAAYEIVDIGEWGFFKRLRADRSEAIPRLEYNGRVLDSIPTSSEIVQFISAHL